MPSTNIDSILSRLTLEEKISLLAGGDVWLTAPIPDKGIPCVKTSDGPNGARGSKIKDGTSSACFPAACSVASTFDVDIACRIGKALGEQALTKGALCLLGPTVCIHRHPLGGRNFESFSEDPFLSGSMATANVNGLQSTGVAATVKHFAVNEQETQRLTVNATVAERALREIYLKPFEMVVKHANPLAVMTAYNKINGQHADSNDFLLKQVLRGEWGWNGLVMSDWGGINSTADSLNAGVDLEMPGPARWRKIDKVMNAINNGEVSQETIDDRARSVLSFLKRLQCFEHPQWGDSEERADDKPEHRAFIREAGAKGIVLLKNKNNVLPLTEEKVKGKTIALFGYAKECIAHGGGSASVKPHYRVTPWDALHEKFSGQDVKLTYSRGAHTFRQLPVLTHDVCDLNGNPGFTHNVYEHGRTTPLKTLHGWNKSEISLLDDQVIENQDIDLVGFFHPSETGRYYFTLSGLGPSRLVINDQVILDQKQNCTDPMGFLFGGNPVPQTLVNMEQGKAYKIQINSAPPSPDQGRDIGFLEGQVGVRVGYMSATEHDKDVLSEAVELAKAADYSIIFTGNDTAWETEGQDQASFHLPKNGSQDHLVAAIAATCSTTIVVNSTGVPVALPWLDQVDSLLQAWFPGQEAGNSIADVLTGAQNPEGHLTCTFPKRLEDCPAFGNFPGYYDSEQKLQVNYEEGLFVGYRHFDRLSSEMVNFPFGFGLSYTTFEFADLNVQQTTVEEFLIQVTVSNTGNLKGSIAVQVYVGKKEHCPADPIKVLVGFRKVTLEAFASATVDITVKVRDFAAWEGGISKWIIEEGDYIFTVGKSAAESEFTSVIKITSREFSP